MKSILFIIFFLISNINGTYAQEDPEARQERIEALKTGFISQKLQLSPAEAEKFWPVYNRYEIELRQVHKEGNNMDVIDKDERLLNIRKKYKAEFSNVLGSRRVNSLFKSENEFRAVLLRHIQHPIPKINNAMPSARPPVNISGKRNLIPGRR